MTTPYGSPPPVPSAQPVPPTDAGQPQQQQLAQQSYAQQSQTQQPFAQQPQTQQSFAQQPQTQQPYAQSPYTQSPYTQQPLAQAAYGVPGELPGGKPAQDPGRTLSIVGIVLAFVCSIAGIVVSAVGRSRSKAAGCRPTLGTVGLVLSICTTVLGVASIAFVAVVGVSAVNGSRDAIDSALAQVQQTGAADGTTTDGRSDTKSGAKSGADTSADAAFCSGFNAANQKMLHLGVPDTSDKAALKKYTTTLKAVDEDLDALTPPAHIAKQWAVVTDYYDTLVSVYSSGDFAGASKLSGKTSDFSDAILAVQDYMIDACY